MTTNAAIDVAIGLVLMYLVLSLVCTTFNEFVATVLGLRARTLKSGLEKILDVQTLKNDFYNHGLVDGGNAAIRGRHIFTERHVSYMTGRTFAMALLGSLDPTKPIPAIADIANSVKNLPDSNIRDTLLAHLATAQNNLQDLRDSVATWFDGAMNRVSGVYKRRLKWISLGVGLAIAAIVNADTITVGKSLWQDAALRAQMVEAANKIVTNGMNTVVPNCDKSTVSCLLDSVKSAETDLRPLPIGWDFSSVGKGWAFWLLKLGGLALTAIALSLGAPFWFDTLSKFVNLRGTGAKPKKTEES
ncbi:MAG TPA: hypothetical protein VN980_12225 [Alphaproteobacteria bacterium]|nr:hypothetical protein [Alphaproteobacteria bacterium]